MYSSDAAARFRSAHACASSFDSNCLLCIGRTGHSLTESSARSLHDATSTNQEQQQPLLDHHHDQHQGKQQHRKHPSEAHDFMEFTAIPSHLKFDVSYYFRSIPGQLVERKSCWPHLTSLGNVQRKRWPTRALSRVINTVFNDPEGRNSLACLMWPCCSLSSLRKFPKIFLTARRPDQYCDASLRGA